MLNVKSYAIEGVKFLSFVEFKIDLWSEMPPYIQETLTFAPDGDESV